MRRNLIRFFVSILVFAFVSKSPAQDLRDPRFVERVQSGFADIFNLDYEKARQEFAVLAKEYPQHPAPPLYLASICWLEEMLRRQDLSLNRYMAAMYFSGKTDFVMAPKERTAFFNNLQKCQDLTKAILKKNRRDMDARYFLATAYGLRASFAITIDHSLREAFSNGNKAYSLSRQLTEEDPNYYDAYLSVGIYEYIVGSMPWYLKLMVFVIGVRGNKQDGMEHVRLASEKGQYIRNEAQLVSMVLNAREHRYAEALEIARSLNRRYPRSFLFPLNAAQILQLTGQKEQAIALFLQVEKKMEAKEPNFDKLPLASYRFNLGVDLMNMSRLDAAEERFRKVISDPQAPRRETALSHLRLARLLDWKSRQIEAIKECQIALSLEDVENSHNQAKQLLKQCDQKLHPSR
jgi:tetratricopeptide (TPR) repeat protein